MSVKNRVPAVEGWFVADGEAVNLIGSQCRQCESYFFPKETFFCRNPDCQSKELDEIPFGRKGTLWSYTNNCYPPPKPYMAPDPFVPYIVAAVQLEEEKMVVLGQCLAETNIDDLKVGMEMELALDVLYEDDDNEYLVWKWKPVGA